VNAVADAGYKAIKLVPPEYWSLVDDHGLALSAIAAHQPLTIGLNRRDQHDRLEDEIKASIENAKRLEIPNLICFSGDRNGLDDQAGAETTAEGLVRVAPAAEVAGITLALELLNSKVGKFGVVSKNINIEWPNFYIFRHDSTITNSVSAIKQSGSRAFHPQIGHRRLVQCIFDLSQSVPVERRGDILHVPTQ
jgi:sugar phosphate isomerase/epimerase